MRFQIYNNTETMLLKMNSDDFLLAELIFHIMTEMDRNCGFLESIKTFQVV